MEYELFLSILPYGREPGLRSHKIQEHLFVCLFVWALEIPVMVLPYFQGVSSSPRGGVGTSLPGLTGGIPTRAWVGNKHS